MSGALKLAGKARRFIEKHILKSGKKSRRTAPGTMVDDGGVQGIAEQLATLGGTALESGTVQEQVPPPPDDVPPPPPPQPQVQEQVPPPPSVEGTQDAVPPQPQIVGDQPPPSEPQDQVPPTPAKTKEEYETARRPLAQDEAAARRIKDRPTALKKLRDAYIDLADATDKLAGDDKYDEAIASLVPLKEALDKAIAGRRKAFEEDTKTKVDDIKNGLEANDVGGKKVRERIGGTKWCNVVDKIIAVQLDEDFTARYDEINAQVAEDLAADPVVKDAYKNWGAWAADPAGHAADIDKVMKKVLELQSKRLGIDPPTKAGTYSKPSDPDDCGGFSTSTKTISLNTASGDFGSFKELLDTLTHENTHAYQTKLIEALRDGSLKPGEPDYAAALALEMNDGAGYISPEDEEEYQKKRGKGVDPYDDQCCEVHAWGAGRKAGQAAYKLLKKNI